MKEIEIYKSGIIRRGWRWRIKADNGKIIAASTESYKNKKDCELNVEGIYKHLVRYFYDDLKEEVYSGEIKNTWLSIVRYGKDFTKTDKVESYQVRFSFTPTENCSSEDAQDVKNKFIKHIESLRFNTEDI